MIQIIEPGLIQASFMSNNYWMKVKASSEIIEFEVSIKTQIKLNSFHLFGSITKYYNSVGQ